MRKRREAARKAVQVTLDFAGRRVIAAVCAREQALWVLFGNDEQPSLLPSMKTEDEPDVSVPSAAAESRTQQQRQTGGESGTGVFDNPTLTVAAPKFVQDTGSKKGQSKGKMREAMKQYDHWSKYVS